MILAAMKLSYPNCCVQVQVQYNNKQAVSIIMEQKANPDLRAPRL